MQPDEVLHLGDGGQRDLVIKHLAREGLNGHAELLIPFRMTMTIDLTLCQPRLESSFTLPDKEGGRELLDAEGAELCSE